MSASEINYIANETTIFFSKVTKIWFIAGLSNMWVVDESNKKIYKYFHKMMTLSIFILIVMEYIALFTQTNLTEKQSSDLILFTFSHPIIIAYYISLEYNKAKVKELFIMLHITLKNIYNDPRVEKRMIRRASFFSIAYLLCITVSLVSYAFAGLMQVIRKGGSFTTVITAWPDVDDNSLLANLAGVIKYIVWWALMARVSVASTLTIIASIAISHQFRNLQSYFHSLNDLFQINAHENNEKENELKYVEALKVGIKLHSDTLWCIKQYHATCGLVYSGQIIINVSVLCLLMLQMVGSERTLMNALTIICTIIAVLTATGLLMLNAGDIGIEAALVPTAMFLSGWHHCHGTTSVIVRKLLITAMMRGQEHVVLRSFRVVEISYRSYLSIVKSSYSAFSLLY